MGWGGGRGWGRKDVFGPGNVFVRDASLSFYSRFYKAYSSIYVGPGCFFFFFRAKEGPVIFFSNYLPDGKLRFIQTD